MVSSRDKDELETKSVVEVIEGSGIKLELLASMRDGCRER
jgi:hypothetical protein